MSDTTEKTMNEPIHAGSLIRCTAGRDKGTYFVVVGVLEPPFVQISDGRTRKVQKPKLKKLKHMEYIAGPEEEITHRLGNKTLTNSVLRKYLFQYNFPDKYREQQDGQRDNAEGGNSSAKR